MSTFPEQWIDADTAAIALNITAKEIPALAKLWSWRRVRHVGGPLYAYDDVRATAWKLREAVPPADPSEVRPGRGRPRGTARVRHPWWGV